MTGRSPAPEPVYWRLPHPMVYVLASGMYWRAACNCHFGRVIGLNWRGRSTR